MFPPSYADLGKSSRDLLNKHYHFGIAKVDIKAKTPTGVDLILNGVGNLDSSRVALSLETKHNIKSHGITLKHKWSTNNNTLIAEATAEDYFLRGLKFGTTLSFAPHSKRSGRLTYGYKSSSLNLNSDVDLDYSGAVNGSGVFGHQGWLAGMKVRFEPTKKKLSKSDFAIGYHAPGYHVIGHLDDGQEFNCSAYQKLNEALEAGIAVTWSTGSNISKFDLGCHYKFDENYAISAKINDHSQFGIGFMHRLGPGVILKLSAMLDVKNINQEGHKIGLGLEFDG